MKQLAFVIVLGACGPAIIKKDPQCSSNVADIQQRLASPAQPPAVKVNGDWQTGGLRWRITTAKQHIVVDSVRQIADELGNAQWVVDERMRGKLDGSLLVFKSETGKTLGRFDAADGTLKGGLYEDCQVVALTFQRVE